MPGSKQEQQHLGLQKALDMGKKYAPKVALGVTMVRFLAGGGPVESPNKYSADNKGNGRPPAGLSVRDSSQSSYLADKKGDQGNTSVKQAGNTSSPPSYDQGHAQDQGVRGKDQSPNNTQARRSTLFDGAHHKGPNSAAIAQARNEIRNTDTFGDPDIISKGKKTESDIEVVASQAANTVGEVVQTVADVGGSAAELFFGSGAILTSCASTLHAGEATPTVVVGNSREATPVVSAYPTFTPDPSLSDPALSRQLATYVNNYKPDSSAAPSTDAQFILYYMGITGRALLGRFPSTNISEFSVRMPLTRSLLNTWESNNASPTLIVSHGQDQYTLSAIVIGNSTEYRIEKLSSSAGDLGFTSDGSNIIRQGKGENLASGKKQADQIWDKATGMWYDGSNLPSDLHGVDVISARNAFAPQLATAARRIYQTNPDAILSEMPSVDSTAKVNWIIVDSTGNRWFPNSKGEATQPPPVPRDMRGRFTDDGTWVWERQGSSLDSPWQTIATFDRESGKMVNVVQPTETPTLSPSPKATAIEAVTATPTAVHGEFSTDSWASFMGTVNEDKIESNAGLDKSKYWLDLVFVLDGQSFNLALSNDALVGIDWARYYRSSNGSSPSNLKDFIELDANGTRKAVIKFLSDKNADYYIGSQLSVILENQELVNHRDNLYFKLDSVGGKVYVTQVKDDVTGKVYSVNLDGIVKLKAPSPTQTLVPEITPAPNQIEWKSPASLAHNDDSRSWKDPGWTNLQETGGHVELLTNGIIRYHVTEGGNVRVQLNKWGETISGPFSVIVPFRMSNGWVYEGDMNVISAFNKTGEQDGVWHNVATVDIDKYGHPFLAPMNQNDDISDRIYFPDGFTINPNILYTFELRVNPDRSLIANLDWDKVDSDGNTIHYHQSVKGKMAPDGGDPVLKNVHSSAYVYSVVKTGPNMDVYVDNGPIEIVKW
ncbi:hypothetical protein M1271_00460 [Patescibacteria group bacterium]|nr:hypothetical protein [Patescibacteria group bacterium]